MVQFGEVTPYWKCEVEVADSELIKAFLLAEVLEALSRGRIQSPSAIG